MKSKITKVASLIMTMLLILTMLPLSVVASSAATFTARTTAPTTSNSYYYSSNPFYNSGYGMPNCTCYAYGRAYELLSTKPKLSTGNAGAWWWYNKNNGYYSYGSTPKLGAIACWDKYDQNKGHVAVVEKINGSTVLISESHYGGTFFNTRTINSDSSNYLTSMRFLGYIYIGSFEEGPHTCSFSGSYFEAAHPHRVYQQCSCGKTQYTGATKAYSSCSSCMKLSWAYAVPFKAYTINTGKTTVYDSVAGSAKSNKIYDTDLCTVSEVYECGWCKVTFPLDSGGTETGYVKISVFMKSGGYITYTSKKLTAYSRSDLKTSIGNTGSGDKIYILGNTSSAVQISYPLSAGGYKVGWIPISSLSATIKYNANGGSGTMSNTSAKYQSAFTLSTNKFTKTGYTFSGWNVYRSSDKKWYTDDNGWQTASSITSKGYTKQTYKNGWSGKLDQSWLNLGKTSETFTFYPIWKANTLSVYYNANGANVNSSTYGVSNNVIYTLNDGEKLKHIWTYNNKLENGLYNASTFGLTKTGYTFKGWGTTSSGGTIFDQDNANLVPTDINSNIKTGSCSTTLYAIWTPNTYKITFNANGGAGAPASQTKTYGKTLTLSSTIPERDGYIFLGWSKSSTATSATYSAGGSFNDNVTTTLYAVWSKEVVYSITYDANGGSSAPAGQTKYDSQDITISTTKPIRSGYTFLGWSTSKTATTAEYISGGVFNKNGNTVLYAIWKPNTYSVGYYANGGVGSMASTIHTYDVEKALAKNGFVREGYVFLGWSSDSDATTAQYRDGGTVSNLSTVNSSYVNLYAVWKEGFYGDINEDGAIDFEDITLVNKLRNGIAEGSQWQKIVADVDGNGEITLEDIELINSLRNGVIDTFPVEEQEIILTVDASTLKSQCYVGENLNTENLSILLYYPDTEVSCDVTDFCEVQLPDTSTIGEKEFIATIGSYTVSYPITVIEHLNTEITTSVVESFVTDATEPKETEASQIITNPTEESTSSTMSTDPKEDMKEHTMVTDSTEEPSATSNSSESKPSDSTEPSTDSSEPTDDIGIIGDVNGDGKVNVKDATLIQKAAAKIIELTDEEKLRADVNADNKNNVKDATAIQKFAAKIETGFPVGEPILSKENN